VPGDTDRRKALLRGTWWLVRLLLVGTVFYYLVRHVAANIDALRAYEVRPDPWVTTAAFAVLVAGLALQSALYHLMLADRPPGLARSFAMMSLPALGKYMPGKVGVVIGTAWVFERCGYRKLRGLYLLLYVQAAIIIGGLLAGTLYSVGAAAGDEAVFWLRLSPLLALGGLPFLHPRLLRWLVARTSRLMKVPPGDVHVPSSTAVTAVAAATGGMVLQGAGFVLLLVAMGEYSGDLALVLLGIYPLAQCLGFLTLVAPGGLGIREGVLMIGLQPVIGAEAAIVSSVAVRVLQTAADLLCAAIGLWIVRRVPREDATP